MKPHLEARAAEMRARYAPRNQGRRSWASRGVGQIVEPYEHASKDTPRWTLQEASDQTGVATYTLEIWRRKKLLRPKDGLYSDAQIDRIWDARQLRRRGLSALAAMRVANRLGGMPVLQLYTALDILRRAGVIPKFRGQRVKPSRRRRVIRERRRRQ